MAGELPTLMVMKSASSGRYVGYTEVLQGWQFYSVDCEKNSVLSPLAKIEVKVMVINGRKYVQLRFIHCNKYWHGVGSRVLALPSPPEASDEKSDALFEPKFGENGFLYLTHVKSGGTVRVDANTNHVCIKLGGGTDELCAFSFVDRDTLVTIPKHVAFKGDNGKYLQAVWYGVPWNRTRGYPNQQFSGSDGNHEYAAYEVYSHPDGHIRVKSEHLGKFWRRSPNWIWGDSDDQSGRDVDTLFWPVKIDDRTIALRNAGNNRFCVRLTTEGKVDCLNAAESKITKEAKLVVEELVLERNIHNVCYQMHNARVSDEQPFVAGVGSATNESDTESCLTIKVAYEDTRSYSFNNNLSIHTGIKTTFETGIPRIVGGKIEVSAEVTKSFEWQRTTTEKKTAEATYTVKVPPKSRVEVNYVGTRGKCSVPFSYTQRDKSSGDGRYITSQHIDGIFEGVNYYSFQFDHLRVEPLNGYARQEADHSHSIRQDADSHSTVKPTVKPRFLSTRKPFFFFFFVMVALLFGILGKGTISYKLVSYLLVTLVILAFIIFRILPSLVLYLILRSIAKKNR